MSHRSLSGGPVSSYVGGGILDDERIHFLCSQACSIFSWRQPKLQFGWAFLFYVSPIVLFLLMENDVRFQI